jgi:hypothetical protein
MAMTMMNAEFWIVTPCRSVEVHQYCGRKSRSLLCMQITSICYLITRIYFDPADGVGTFLRNVGKLLLYFAASICLLFRKELYPNSVLVWQEYLRPRKLCK